MSKDKGSRSKQKKQASKKDKIVTKEGAPCSPEDPASPPTPPVSDHLTFAFIASVGHKAEVQVRDGTVYQGVFNTAVTEDKMEEEMKRKLCVVLSYAKTIVDPTRTMSTFKEKAQKPAKSLTFMDSDIRSITIKDIKLSAADLAPRTNNTELITDSAISQGKGGFWGRELQPWAPEDDGDGLLLEEEGTGESWDQFGANARLFAYESTYDELQYTTAIKPDQCGITEAEAERLAHEVMHQKPCNNPHLAEERGQTLEEEEELDEEARYSAVIGTGGTAAPKITPATPDETATSTPALVSQKSSPISIPVDPRKETNKVRQHLSVTVRKDRSSPFGTPIGLKSPLNSPLVGNPNVLEALDLNPGTTKIDAETLKQYKQWKQQQAQEEAAKSRREEQLRGLKSFSSSVKVPVKASAAEEPPTLQSAASAPPTATEERNGSLSPDAGLSTPPTPTNEAPETSIPAEPVPPAAPAKDASPPPPSQSSPPPAPAAPATSTPPAALSEAPVKSRLNPNARPFKLNANAAEFQPRPANTSVASTAGSVVPSLPSGASTPTSGVGSRGARPFKEDSHGPPSSHLTPNAHHGAPPYPHDPRRDFPPFHAPPHYQGPPQMSVPMADFRPGYLPSSFPGLSSSGYPPPQSMPMGLVPGGWMAPQGYPGTIQMAGPAAAMVPMMGQGPQPYMVMGRGTPPHPQYMANQYPAGPVAYLPMPQGSSPGPAGAPFHYPQGGPHQVLPVSSATSGPMSSPMYMTGRPYGGQSDRGSSSGSYRNHHGGRNRHGGGGGGGGGSHQR